MENGSYYFLNTYFVASTRLGVTNTLSHLVSTVSLGVDIATLIYQRRELNLGEF